jgi:peptidoglycan/LPS O-acetylase OafA/YrhL
VLEHRPQLDSVRAFAVLAVLLGHFCNVPIGGQGVELFFVLSGFLITRILIDSKSQCEHLPGLHRSFFLRQFYARRFLRIFPPYYALLLVLCLATLWNPDGRLGWDNAVLWKSMWFHVTYTSNFWFALTGELNPGITSHFWSLAIEEQFYLFWPWIIMSVPRKHLWIAALLLTLSAPAFRAAILAYHANRLAVGILTPAYFDFLGLGGLLAVVWEKRRARLALRLFGGAAIVLLSVGLAFGFAMAQAMVLWALAFTALVSKAAEGFGGPLGSLLRWSVLRYIGRISYGVYLYHFPAALLVAKICNKLGVRFPDLGIYRFLVMGIVTVAIAALSWHLFEGPINRLKRFFPYRPRRRPSGVGLPAVLQA